MTGYVGPIEKQTLETTIFARFYSPEVTVSWW